MEQKNDSAYVTRWMEKRSQSPNDAKEDIDFLTMLAELSRGQQ